MKVLLKQDVENIGLAGEVHKVSNGYGRNFLLPQGMAVIASPGMMKQAEVWRKKAETRREEIRAEFEALAAKVSGVRLAFTARAGENGKLYGSITTAQVADEMNQTLGTEIDRRKVGIEPLRQLGEHKVVVRLSGEFQPELTVVITSEEEDVATEAVVEAAADIDEAEPAAEEPAEA